MKRILFILDHAYGGGAEIVTLNLAKTLTEQYQVGLILLDPHNINIDIDPCIQRIFISDQSQFVRSRFWKKKEFSDVFKFELLDTIEKFSADLVIISFWNSLHLVNLITHPNVFYWIHGNIFFQTPTPKSNYILRNFIRKIRQPFFFNKLLNGQNILTVNNEMNRRITQICPKSNVYTLYNGIPYTTTIEKIKLENKRWDAMYVGRLSGEKQVDHAIRAFSQSQLKGKMAIIGHGNLEEKLKKLVTDLNLNSQIYFLGWLTPQDVNTHIQQSHLLVLSSQTEGFPLIISESLLLGTPVVAYECCDGINYQLSGNATIGLSIPNNINDLAQKMKLVHANPYVISEVKKTALSMQTMYKNFKKITNI